MRRGESLQEAVDRWLQEVQQVGADGFMMEGWQSTVGNQTINPRALEVIRVVNVEEAPVKLGTKTHSEREEEEIERLVRPDPKNKPPRNDLRRERVEVGDADTAPQGAESDRDLSLNYKRVAVQQALRRTLQASPPSGGDAKHKPGDVWQSKDGWTGKNPDGVSHSFGERERAQLFAKGEEVPEGGEGGPGKDDTAELAKALGSSSKAEEALGQLKKDDPELAALLEKPVSLVVELGKKLNKMISQATWEKKDLTPEQEVERDDLWKQLLGARAEIGKALKTKKEVPKKEVPKKEVPKKEAPEEEVPKEEAPKEEVPKGEAPEEGAPEEDTNKVTPEEIAAVESLAKVFAEGSTAKIVKQKKDLQKSHPKLYTRLQDVFDELDAANTAVNQAAVKAMNPSGDKKEKAKASAAVEEAAKAKAEAIEKLKATVQEEPAEEGHKPGDVWKTDKGWSGKNPEGESQSFEEKEKAEAFAKGEGREKGEEDEPASEDGSSEVFDFERGLQDATDEASAKAWVTGQLAQLKKLYPDASVVSEEGRLVDNLQAWLDYAEKTKGTDLIERNRLLQRLHQKIKDLPEPSESAPAEGHKKTPQEKTSPEEPDTEVTPEEKQDADLLKRWVDAVDPKVTDPSERTRQGYEALLEQVKDFIDTEEVPEQRVELTKRFNDISSQYRKWEAAQAKENVQEKLQPPTAPALGTLPTGTQPAKAPTGPLPPVSVPGVAAPGKSTPEREKFDRDIRKVERRLQKAKEEAAEAPAKLAQAEQDLDTVKRTLTDVKKEVQKAEAEVAKAKQDLARVPPEKKKKAEAVVDRAEKQAQKAAKDLAAAEKEVSKAEDAVTKAEDKVDSAPDEVKEAQEVYEQKVTEGRERFPDPSTPVGKARLALRDFDHGGDATKDKSKMVKGKLESRLSEYDTAAQDRAAEVLFRESKSLVHREVTPDLIAEVVEAEEQLEEAGLSAEAFGEVAARVLFGYKTLSNPSAVVKLSDNALDATEEKAVAEKSFKHYSKLTPKMRAEAFKQASVQLQEYPTGSPKGKQLSRVLDGLHLASISAGDDPKVRQVSGKRLLPEPSGMLRSLIKLQKETLGDDALGLGSEEDVLSLMSSDFYGPKGRASLKRKISDLSDSGLTELFSAGDKELESMMKSYLSQCKEPWQKKLLREMMGDLTLDSITTQHAIITNQMFEEEEGDDSQIEERSTKSPAKAKDKAETKAPGKHKRPKTPEEVDNLLTDFRRRTMQAKASEVQDFIDCLNKHKKEADAEDCLKLRDQYRIDSHAYFLKLLEDEVGITDKADPFYVQLQTMLKKNNLAELDFKFVPEGGSTGDTSAKIVPSGVTPTKEKAPIPMWWKKASNTEATHSFQSFAYTEGVLSEGLSAHCSFFDKGSPIRSADHMRRHSMAGLTKKGARSVTQALDRVASLFQEEWKTLGVSQRVANDFAYRCDLLSDHVERTASSGKRALDELDVVKEKGFDPEEIGVEQPGPIEIVDKAEPFMQGEFTQQENRELRERYQAGELGQGTNPDPQSPAPGKQASFQRMGQALVNQKLASMCVKVQDRATQLGTKNPKLAAALLRLASAVVKVQQNVLLGKVSAEHAQRTLRALDILSLDKPGRKFASLVALATKVAKAEKEEVEVEELKEETKKEASRRQRAAEEESEDEDESEEEEAEEEDEEEEPKKEASRRRAGEIPPQFLKNVKKKKEEAEEKKDDGKKGGKKASSHGFNLSA
jgi:hypothetical protein